MLRSVCCCAIIAVDVWVCRGLPPTLMFFFSFVGRRNNRWYPPTFIFREGKDGELFVFTRSHVPTASTGRGLKPSETDLICCWYVVDTLDYRSPGMSPLPPPPPLKVGARAFFAKEFALWLTPFSVSRYCRQRQSATLFMLFASSFSLFGAGHTCGT